MPVFIIIVYLIIILGVIRAVKRKNLEVKSGGRYKITANTTQNSIPISEPVKAEINRDISVAKEVYKAPAVNAYRAEKSTHSSMEDRNNDWLAKQFREERKALHIANGMFGQQMEHRTHCDAQMLKEFHMANCSAGGIDNPGK